MPSEIRIYFEGDAKLKRGFSAFLSSLRDTAAAHKCGWTLIAGGSRVDTLEDFEIALRKHADAFSVLLVDSEAAVDGKKPWTHLEKSHSYSLRRPAAAGDDSAHLMVQAMEAWFIADRDAVADYYKQGFLPKRLPAREDVESIPKADLVKSLRKASEKTQKGPYDKTRHAPDLLAMVDPAKVRAALPWCDRLFNTISEVIQGT